MRTIALLTDFGTRDPYVAAMKGVIAARTNAPIVDLTHEIAPFDVFEGAWFLRTIAPYWRESVFVCVVDPGVGTARKIVALEHDGSVFLAPDNGLLTFVDGRAYSVEEASFFLPDGSRTFHGRDRFAPVAAAIANGVSLTELGPRLPRIERLHYEEPAFDGTCVRGSVVAVDRFGNLITDVEVARLPFHAFELRTGNVMIDRVESVYGGAEPGAFLIEGSAGTVEISVANGSAAEHLQMRRLDRIELWPKNGESS